MAKIEIGKLLYKIGLNKDGKFDSELKKTEKQVKKTGLEMSKASDKAKKLGKGFLSLKTAVLGFLTGTLIKGIKDLAKSGAELDSLSRSFDRLSNEMGISSKKTLSTLKEVSGGTISNKDLILSANRAMVLGVAESTEEFGELMSIARLRARDMGLTTTQAFNDIVTGVGRGSPLILDNLGITIKATEAQNEYATSIGKVAENLTEAEKKEALKFAVLKQGAEDVARAGKLTLSYAEEMERLNVRITNTKDNIGKGLLPAFSILVKDLGTMQDETDKSAKKFNGFSYALFRLSLSIRSITNGVKSAFIILGKTIAVTFANAGHSVLKFLNKMKLVSKEKVAQSMDTVRFAVEDLDNSVIKLADEAGELGRIIKDPRAEFNKLNNMISNTSTELENLDEELGNTGDNLEKNKERVEKWKDSLEEAKEEAIKTAKELSGDLKKSFDEFSKGLGQNIEETSKGLADIVLNAERRREEIKEALRTTDDGKERKALREELRGVQDVLKAREDFEKEHLEKITGIRAKLSDAGIDPDSLGISDGTNSGLEDQIAEKKRVASLDEFTRFKEQQFAKLDILTNDFITETGLYEQKIQRQKDLEVSFTKFLQQQVTSRKQMMESLRMGDFASPSSITSGARSGASGSNSTVNNEFNISNNIGGTAKEMNAEELTAIMSFELDKHK